MNGTKPVTNFTCTWTFEIASSVLTSEEIRSRLAAQFLAFIDLADAAIDFDDGGRVVTAHAMNVSSEAEVLARVLAATGCADVAEVRRRCAAEPELRKIAERAAVGDQAPRLSIHRRAPT